MDDEVSKERGTYLYGADDEVDGGGRVCELVLQP